ncbi:hypothetical protein [Bacillus sp. ISL-37]|nr:hypothetical protein [Bacillus sp. ISL-37]
MIFTITAYLLYWTIVMPGWFVVPFLISLTIGLVTLFVSKRIDK